MREDRALVGLGLWRLLVQISLCDETHRWEVQFDSLTQGVTDSRTQCREGCWQMVLGFGSAGVSTPPACNRAVH